MDKKNTNYQMKRRRYGYGWTPVTWQSWMFIVAQLGIIFTAMTFLLSGSEQPTTGDVIRFLLILAFSLTTLMLFTRQTGPKPKWRWGKKPSDNPDEDF